VQVLQAAGFSERGRLTRRIRCDANLAKLHHETKFRRGLFELARRGCRCLDYRDPPCLESVKKILDDKDQYRLDNADKVEQVPLFNLE